MKNLGDETVDFIINVSVVVMLVMEIYFLFAGIFN